MRKWKLEDAKNRFSELVRLAEAHDPQLVTRNGKDAVVVLSVDDYALLGGSDSLADFLKGSPLADAFREDGLELDRAHDEGRPFEL